jgi:hypothetical protein
MHNSIIFVRVHNHEHNIRENLGYNCILPPQRSHQKPLAGDWTLFGAHNKVILSLFQALAILLVVNPVAHDNVKLIPQPLQWLQYI